MDREKLVGAAWDCADANIGDIEREVKTTAGDMKALVRDVFVAGAEWRDKHAEFVSPRGIKLVIEEKPLRPTITVELYMKWYDLFLVDPSGSVRAVDQDKDHADLSRSFHGTAWGDHVVNPAFVVALARANNWAIDSRAYELIVGRWSIEHLNLFECDV